MKYIKIYPTILCLSLLFFFPEAVSAQQTEEAAAFTGARAHKEDYRAVFQLNSDNKEAIEGTLRNMAHVLDDPRIKGKVHLELVAHSGGIKALMKNSKFEKELKFLADHGVLLSACENTMKANNVKESDMYPFVSFVPSGVAELVIRQQQGWAYIHP